jgi:hypothetical protein
MVRRGSTLRVRQRALQKPRKSGLPIGRICRRFTLRWVWSSVWSLQVEADLRLRSEWSHEREDIKSAHHRPSAGWAARGRTFDPGRASRRPAETSFDLEGENRASYSGELDSTTLILPSSQRLVSGAVPAPRMCSLSSKASRKSAWVEYLGEHPEPAIDRVQ